LKKNFSTTHNFVNLLANPVVETRSILLDLVNRCPQVVAQLLRRESQLADWKTDDSITLAVDGTTAKILNTGSNILNDSTGLCAGHEAARTEDSTQASLVESRHTVRVSQAAVELDSTSLHSLKDFGFTNQDGTGGERILRVLRIGGTDDANSGFGLNGVRESDHVSDDGAIFPCAQANVCLVFDDGWIATDLHGAEIAVVENKR
jgi:hypothetical protein